MHPEYEKYRNQFEGEKPTLTVRTPAQIKEALEMIATAEHDTVSALLIEGAIRVIESRTSEESVVAYRASVEERRRLEDQALETFASIGKDLLGPKPE